MQHHDDQASSTTHLELMPASSYLYYPQQKLFHEPFDNVFPKGYDIYLKKGCLFIVKK